MNAIIKVEKLAKKYILRHQQSAGYRTLRESIYSGFKRIKERLLGKESSFKSKEEFWALQDISFKVGRGDKLAIIGRNGAGKSTLLKLLSRITVPTKGRIELNGRVASLLEVGTGFHPELTGRENIFLSGSVMGMKRAEIKRKFDEIVSFSGIERFLDTPVKRYSSGMYVRLAFSVAAHLEPEILLIDEVLAVGDFEFQKKCLGKMDEVAKVGRTILFVSHNMGAIKNLCDYGILLDNGKISEKGDIDNIITNYYSHFESINPVDLTLIKHGGKQRFSFLRSLSIFDIKGNLCNIFKIGSSIIFKFNLELKEDVENLELGILIIDSVDICIHRYISSWEGLKMKYKKGIHFFQVEIPDILLFPGSYTISIWSAEDGYWSDDNVNQVTTIEIIQDDITGFLKKNKIKNSFEKFKSSTKVYAKSIWTSIT